MRMGGDEARVVYLGSGWKEIHENLAFIARSILYSG